MRKGENHGAPVKPMIGKLDPTTSTAIEGDLKVLGHLFRADDDLSDVIELLTLCDDIPTEVYMVLDDLQKRIAMAMNLTMEQPHRVMNAEKTHDRRKEPQGNR